MSMLQIFKGKYQSHDGVPLSDDSARFYLWLGDDGKGVMKDRYGLAEIVALTRGDEDNPSEIFMVKQFGPQACKNGGARNGVHFLASGPGHYSGIFSPVDYEGKPHWEGTFTMSPIQKRDMPDDVFKTEVHDDSISFAREIWNYNWSDPSHLLWDGAIEITDNGGEPTRLRAAQNLRGLNILDVSAMHAPRCSSYFFSPGWLWFEAAEQLELASPGIIGGAREDYQSRRDEKRLVNVELGMMPGPRWRVPMAEYA